MTTGLRSSATLLRRLAAFGVWWVAAASFGAGGGGGGGGMAGGSSSSPRDIAAAHFMKGESYRKAGLEALESAQAATTDEERSEALAKASEKWKRALREYREATRADRSIHQAWNGMGFAQRMLGDFDASLASYDRALKLEPGFPNAIEYRAEAYLMLGRLDDAKAAYLDLFGRERAFADLLLRKMQAWLQLQRSQPSADATHLDAFAKWIDERAAIAQQTASLAPEASVVASW